jgi:fermentation-respiration switch protein FrsA (DUF1100 family)
MTQSVDARKSARPKRKTARILMWILIGMIALLVVAYFGIGAVAASQLTVPKRRGDFTKNPGIYNLKYEDLRIPSRGDGLEIAAWYIPSETNEYVIILVHGRDDSRMFAPYTMGEDAHADGYLPFAKVLHDAGYSVMMIDLRGHGQSADSRYYFGLKEYQDVLGAVDWLEGRGFQPGKIGIQSYSLGSVSAIYATAKEPDIGALWIDSSYTDLKSLMDELWVQVSGLPQIFLPSTRLMISVLYGWDIADSRPIDEIGKIAPRPIFMAHCQQDDFIPISHMEQLIPAANPVGTWVIQGCKHAFGYNVAAKEYNQKAIAFFDEFLK